MSSYLGMPSPACHPHRTATLQGHPTTYVGSHGEGLASANLKGGHWIRHHDDIKDTLADFCKLTHAPVQTEVRHAYTPYIRDIARFNNMLTNSRGGPHGVIPDLGVTLANRKYLGEVKVIHFCPSRYRHALTSDVSPVNTRASAILTEYRRHTKEVCDHYCGGDTALLSFFEEHELLCLTVGAFGEASKDVHKLLDSLATKGAQSARNVGSSSARTSKAALLWRLRTEFSVRSHRANARLKLDRMRYIRRPGARAEQTQHAATPHSAGPPLSNTCQDFRAYTRDHLPSGFLPGRRASNS